MKVFSILEQIRTQVAKYSEFWSLNINRAPPHIPSLTTPHPSPHNLVQKKHVLHRCRLLYLRAVQRVLKTHWDSRRLDWTRLGRCEHPLTLESHWSGLDSTRLCWCVRTLKGEGTVFIWQLRVRRTSLEKGNGADLGTFFVSRNL